MTYHLTPEQVKKNRAQDWNVMSVMGFIAFGAILFVTWPSFARGTTPLSTLLVIWAIMLVIVLLSAFVGQANVEKKRVHEVETAPDALYLVSPKGRQEVFYSSIVKAYIMSSLEGKVRTVFLKTETTRPVLLQGFDDMDGLAGELEKKVADPAKIVQNRFNPTAKGRGWGMLLGVGILVGVLGILGGGAYLMTKMGLGALLGPVGFVLLGFLKLATGKGNKEERLIGIAFLGGGLLWAILKIVGH